jgi:hypothetical protein
MPHIFNVRFKYVIPYLEKRITYLLKYGYKPDNSILDESGLYHDVLPGEYEYIGIPYEKQNIPYFDYIFRNRFLFNLIELKKTLEKFEEDDVLLCCNPKQFNTYGYEQNEKRVRENADVKAQCGVYVIQNLLEEKMLKDTVYNVLKYL